MKASHCALLVLLTLASPLLHAQPGSELAPAVAREHLAKAHPGAKVEKWEQRKRNLKATFTVKGIEHDAYYTPAGTWVRTEQEIHQRDLPPAVAASLKTGPYAKWRTKDLELHNTPAHAVLYKVQLEDGKDRVDLFLTPEGTLVKERKKGSQAED